MGRLRGIRILACVVIALVTGACSSRPAQPTLPGDTFPYTKLTMFDGSTRILEEYEGRRVAMIFWATWCPKSRRAIRHFNEFARSYPRHDVAFLAININSLEDERAVKTKIREEKLTAMQHVYSGNETQDEAFVTFGADQVPFFVVLDRKGRIVYRGGDEDEVFKAVSRRG